MWQKLSSSIVFIGGVSCICGFLGLFYWPLTMLLALPLWELLRILQKLPSHFQTAMRPERILLLILAGWWVLHFIQVGVPETGFDAVWYHLPVTKMVVEKHRFIADPNFYQTFNPLFADSIFFLGYLAGGEQGAKWVAYGFGLSLVVVTYGLSRKYLNRTFSLLVCVLVSGFQVVSWQSASFYIDLAKALFELAALAFLLERKFLQAGCMLGASLASKLFSIALAPIYLWLGKKWQLLISLVFLLPFLGMAYTATKNPLYSLTIHGEHLVTFQHILKQTTTLPKMLLEIGITRDYTHPILLVLAPLLIIQRKKLHPIFPLLLLGGAQLGLWWYLPPQSTRYAVSGFVCLTIAVVWLLQHTIKREWLLPLLICSGCLAFPIRILAVKRSMEYILGQKNKEAYLRQFLDGNIDTPLKNWHGLQ